MRGFDFVPFTVNRNLNTDQRLQGNYTRLPEKLVKKGRGSTQIAPAPKNDFQEIC